MLRDGNPYLKLYTIGTPWYIYFNNSTLETLSQAISHSRLIIVLMGDFSASYKCTSLGLLALLKVPFL